MLKRCLYSPFESDRRSVVFWFVFWGRGQTKLLVPVSETLLKAEILLVQVFT